ncbi:MAG: hypothetical protein ABIR06_12955 [Cyclobacteriaceae bacterium]
MGHGNIAGIHNYCDRWCERCFFTSRCAVYAEVSDLPNEQLDLRNKAFWQRLGDNFSKAKDLLEQAAERYGVELKELHGQMELTEKKQKEIREESTQHPISQLSLEYSDVATQWLKTQPGMLDRLDALKTGLILGVQSNEGAKEETIFIKDGLAVIHWYCTFIHIKLMRALMGKLDNDGWEAENDFPRDFDGSAKVALIAIERSMQAWIKLFEILPDKEDDFLKILSLLEKLKSLVREEFPEAEAFVRPGFDEDHTEIEIK